MDCTIVMLSFEKMIQYRFPWSQIVLKECRSFDEFCVDQMITHFEMISLELLGAFECKNIGFEIYIIRSVSFVVANSLKWPPKHIIDHLVIGTCHNLWLNNLTFWLFKSYIFSFGMFLFLHFLSMFSVSMCVFPRLVFMFCGFVPHSTNNNIFFNDQLKLLLT